MSLDYKFKSRIVERVNRAFCKLPSSCTCRCSLFTSRVFHPAAHLPFIVVRVVSIILYEAGNCKEVETCCTGRGLRLKPLCLIVKRICQLFNNPNIKLLPFCFLCQLAQFYKCLACCVQECALCIAFIRKKSVYIDTILSY